MADDVSIKVEGALELRKALRKADADLPKELTAIHRKLAELVVRHALPNVPVRSGKLAASVKAQASQRYAKTKAGTAKSVPYAAAVHWGEGTGNINHRTGQYVGRPARNIQGRPFLWEAVNQLRPQVADIYMEEIEDLVNEAVRNR